MFNSINISFFIGPIIGGFLANAYTIKTVFSIAAIFPFLVFLLLFTQKGKTHNTRIEKVNLFANIKNFFRNKNLLINYFISLGLMAWLTIIYIYLPLYMSKEGLSEKTIGLVLAFTVIPLVILEIPVTKLTKYFGYKKLFCFGFLLIALFGIATFFTNQIYIKLLFFILTNLGIAFVEPLKEAYFFETNKRSDEVNFYPIFKTSSDVGNLTGPLIFSTILLFTNFSIMFLVASILMLIFALISLTLKETK